MLTDYAIHSDLLVHWTGSDIDEKYDSKWHTGTSSETSQEPKLEEEYHERLLSILEHGFWMTDEDGCCLDLGSSKVTVPPVARTCFSELRLSQSRNHAKRFGRLGVGVKRPFVSERGERPVAYYHGHKKYVKHDIFLEACAAGIENPSLLHFFKSMHQDPNKVDFENFAESEWRIIHHDKLAGQGHAVDPGCSPKEELCAYFSELDGSQKAKLRYLVPLDGWLAVIIYPSVSLKNRARKAVNDPRIRDAIQRIKDLPDRANRVEGGQWPVEMDLDLCRNF